MAIFKPFKAVRPTAKNAVRLLCPPYDVVGREQAINIACSDEMSFMHIIRSETDLPDEDAYSENVYKKASENLNDFLKKGILNEDSKPSYYIYSQTMSERTQTGIIGCASIDDYEADIIRKHEKTRSEKEQDRIRHFDACNANTEPIFLMHKHSDTLEKIIAEITENDIPVYEVTDKCNVIHKLWTVNNDDEIETIDRGFEKLEALYIADGHHRAASAVKVGHKRRKANPAYNGSEEFNRFMAVSISADKLNVLGYHRLLTDLNGMNKDEFLSALNNICNIDIQTEIMLPDKEHNIVMYIDNTAYKLSFHKNLLPETSDIIGNLDVSLLQNNILAPLLGIKDPRTDKRISFSGGIDCEKEIINTIDSGKAAVAFFIYPISVDNIMKVADAGLVMPPKSTWFEPKLGSGWFVHLL